MDRATLLRNCREALKLVAREKGHELPILISHFNGKTEVECIKCGRTLFNYSSFPSDVKGLGALENCDENEDKNQDFHDK